MNGVSVDNRPESSCLVLDEDGGRAKIWVLGEFEVDQDEVLVP